MTTNVSVFAREVARIDRAPEEAGHVPGHRARRLIDASDPAFTDPFLVMAEDWMPRGAFPRHPHRGIETVTYVIEARSSISTMRVTADCSSRVTCSG